MKKIVFSIVTIMMLLLASCKSDTPTPSDGNQPGGETVNVVRSINISYPPVSIGGINSDFTRFEYEYDKKGRLTEIDWEDSEENKEIDFDIFYDINRILVNIDGNFDYKSEMDLNADNQVTKLQIKGKESLTSVNFTYEGKKLKSHSFVNPKSPKLNHVEVFEWKGDNLVKIYTKERGDLADQVSINIEYYPDLLNTCFPDITQHFEFMHLENNRMENYGLVPELRYLMGMRSRNLPKKVVTEIISEFGGHKHFVFTTDISYSFDDKGRLDIAQISTKEKNATKPLKSEVKVNY
ncbi:Uncharacterised protein [Porphyromonas macacae]|uniref:DUF4595 domain-containing protein n=2 Tax=Porphyromonas macacae TaxID=28115 RepID=A0A379E7U8_9PORP|nr:Uncharacterised protein [Porphyromonas macacae]